MQDKTISPLLSIVVPTYNHGLYLTKTIDSILMQKTNFAYEILIGDDCSTDNSRDLLKTYKSKYPEKIHLFLSEKNQGITNMAATLYKKCLGKYIAVLEGDDRWTYESKLQEQVDFLENNTDYAGCFHDAEVVVNYDPSGDNTFHSDQCYSEFRLYSQFNRYRSDFFPYDLLQRNIIPTASLVFRNYDISDFFIKFSRIKYSLQWALHLYIIKGSKFRYFNKAWSVYNDHPQGVTKKNNIISFNKTNIEILKILKKDSYYKFCRLDMNRALLNEYREILYCKEAKELPFSCHIKYFLSYRRYTIRLFFSETAYFFRLRRKKNK